MAGSRLPRSIYVLPFKAISVTFIKNPCCVYPFVLGKSCCMYSNIIGYVCNMSLSPQSKNINGRIWDRGYAFRSWVWSWTHLEFFFFLFLRIAFYFRPWIDFIILKIHELNEILGEGRFYLPSIWWAISL